MPKAPELDIASLAGVRRNSPSAPEPHLDASAGMARIVAAFTFALAVVAAITWFAYLSARQVRESVDVRDHTFVVLHTAGDILSSIRDAEAAQRSYLLTGDARYFGDYESAIGSLGSTMIEMRGLLAEPRQRQRLEAVEALVNARLERFAIVLERRRAAGGTTSEVIANMGTGRETMEQLERKVDELQRAERENLAARDAPLQQGLEHLVLAVGLGGLFTVLLTAFAARRIHLGAQRQLRMQLELLAMAEKARLVERGLNQELADRARSLQEANHELESFSYTVSHDLRAPLRHVQGYIELLNGALPTPPTGKAERYLRIINEAAQEMGTLIDDLLAFSQTSRTELHVGDVALDPMVAAAIAGLEMETRGRNIEWKVGALPTVRADPALLKQVWSNLLGNAAKYSRMRDPAVIEIGEVRREAGRVELFVRDNGAGFDMRHADKLFGVFQRLHHAREFEGTGIGLATVQRIVARHGGEIRAEAEPDRGAVFFFTLPLGSGDG